MMRHQRYLDRAMRASDPRYERIFGLLGHAPRPVRPTELPEEEQLELKALRDSYTAMAGKKPFMGWGIDELRRRISQLEQ